MSIKEKQGVLSIKLSEQGTATIDGAKIVSESMEFGRAIGFGMDGSSLMLTIDQKKCGNHLPFDVLEKLMKIIAGAKKE